MSDLRPLTDAQESLQLFNTFLVQFHDKSWHTRLGAIASFVLSVEGGSVWTISSEPSVRHAFKIFLAIRVVLRFADQRPFVPDIYCCLIQVGATDWWQNNCTASFRWPSASLTRFTWRLTRHLARHQRDANGENCELWEEWKAALIFHPNFKAHRQKIHLDLRWTLALQIQHKTDETICDSQIRLHYRFLLWNSS